MAFLDLEARPTGVRLRMEWDRIRDSTRAIRDQVSAEPRIGIVLGTGLGALANEIRDRHVDLL